MPSKYTVLGFSLVTFIIIALYLQLRNGDGMNPLLFEAKNIDSVQLYKEGKTISMTNPNDFLAISSELKSCKQVSPDRININTAFTDLYFWIKNKKTRLSVRILYTYYDGIVVIAGDLYYKNDKLDQVITNYLAQQ